MEDQVKQNHEIELLKLEYRECQAGYNSRDDMTEDEFCKVVQLFWLFVTIILALNVFTTIGRFFHCAVCIIIGVAGLFCLLSLLVSIESNASCNVALRQRCKKIEDRLCDLVGFKLQYWQVIDERDKYLEEELVKGRFGAKVGGEKERERSIFVNTVRLLILLWIVIVAVAVVRGIPSK